MKFEVKYRHLKPLKKLEKYAEDKYERLEKYELKPSSLTFVFSAKQHHCVAEVAIKGPDLYCRATAAGEDHYKAIDLAMDKLERQLAKRKTRVQFHKRPEFSKAGRLSRMNAQMEHGLPVHLKTRRGPNKAA